ncbi:MAG: phage portal protein [Novosphingobium meiothermophilum]
MSLFDRILGILGWPETPHNVDIPNTPITEITSSSASWSSLFEGIPGLPKVTDKTVLSVSAAYACVNLIAGAISALPVKIYRESRDGQREELPSDDLWYLLNEEFLPRWSAAHGWEYAAQSLLFHGDAFMAIRRQGARIVGLEPAHSDNVQVLASKDRMRLIYVVRWENGAVETIDQDDMIHVAGFGFNGFRGVTPLRHVLGTSAAIAIATQEYAGRFFANSARADVVLSTDQAINRETADEIRNRWAENYAGYQNSHRPAVLGSGFTIKQLTMNAEDAQLLATRQFQIEEIARAFGVPPFMIGHVEKTTSWGSGVESMGKAFVRFTLRQHLNKFQTEINRKFFRNAGKRVEFDTFDLESADMKTLFESFRVAIGRAGEPAFMTTDEVRDKLRLKRTAGGNVLGSGQLTGTGNATEQAA